MPEALQLITFQMSPKPACTPKGSAPALNLLCAGLEEAFWDIFYMNLQTAFSQTATQPHLSQRETSRKKKTESTLFHGRHFWLKAGKAPFQ